MKVGVVGSRNCGALTVQDIIRQLPANCSQIISGGAEGVDALAKEAALLLGLGFIEILPDYAAYGKSAPLVRNVQIVDECDMVLAFWDLCSNGTKHVVASCIEKKRYFKIIPT